jgi:DNA-directed RNA polymerase specialized sigma24 family protein
MSCHLLSACGDAAAGFSSEQMNHQPEHDQPRKVRTNQVYYATPADFCRVFHDHVDDLYTLSLLLTADGNKAEQCFLSSLEDCLLQRQVFQEWAQSWARRTIVTNAIRIIDPGRDVAGYASGTVKENTPAAALTSLQPFERFVYVLSVLEKYSDRECSILLGRTIRNVIDARTRALQRIADASARVATTQNASTRGAA